MMNTSEVAIRCGEHAFTRLQKLLPQQDRLLPKIYQTEDDQYIIYWDSIHWFESSDKREAELVRAFNRAFDYLEECPFDQDGNILPGYCFESIIAEADSDDYQYRSNDFKSVIWLEKKIHLPENLKELSPETGEETNLLEIESQIQKVQKKILNIRQKEYQHLLGKEIAFCCDCIALNILQRPTQGSIADCAVDNLNRRIQVAQLSNLPSPYNLSIFLHVLQLDGKAYLRVDCNNPIFQKAFRSLEDVSVSAVECQDPKNSKNILWQKLCKRYEEMLPLSKNLTTELYPDWEHITYPDVNSRCEDFARQNIANSYLTHLNAGQQMIPPHLLMPYVEESIDYLQSEYGKNEYREKVLFLKKVFIDLNADDSIVRNIQPQFKTEEEPVINENTETDLEK